MKNRRKKLSSIEQTIKREIDPMQRSDIIKEWKWTHLHQY